jgi:type IV secretory pathway VirB4 component
MNDQQNQTQQPASQDARALAQQNIKAREEEASDPNFWQKQQAAQAGLDPLEAGLSSVRDIIAPAAFVVTPNYLQLGAMYVKTMFVFTYPRYLETNWLSPIINYDLTMDIGMYIHPLESKNVMYDLKKQIGKLESTRQIEAEKGSPRDPEIETALGDIESLRDVLQRGEIRLFQFGMYFTIYANTPEELGNIVEQLESTLGGMLIYTKETLLQMEQGFTATLPLMMDEINVLRNLDTGSLSSTFPFVSTELTQDSGILYGINRHNNSLIIFDRFSLENANSVVFAKSGSGKSYAVKLEILRYLMLGTDVVIVDPENEYKSLCEAVGGSYLTISLNSEHRINPFDLPHSQKESAESGEDVLRSTISSVHGLVNLMVGGLSPEEDAVVDKALYETYGVKDITTDPESQKNEPPVLQDFYNVLSNMNGTDSLRARLSKYTEGTYANLFNQTTNFELVPGFVVFSVRDLEEQLRPIAMYLILNYIWTKIRMDMRRRIMVIDEAWWMMQYEDSAKFLYGLVKRARKYYLGVTVISQDVEDFLGSRYGKAVVANSSMQLLMKQSTSSIDIITETFNLTEGEKYLLLESDVGEGLFFAGLNHVAVKVVASYAEDQIITTDPKQLLGEA